MMWITDQSVPPEYADQMAAILSTLPSAPGVPGQARTRRAARMSANTYTVRTAFAALADAVAYLADKLQYPPRSQPRRGFEYARLRELLTGEVNPDYWQQLPAPVRRIFTSTPSSIPDPDPPPYAYRDPANLPTIPTYPDGTLTTGTPLYSGSTSAGYFNDDNLTWSRSTYNLITPIDDDDRAPVIARVTADLDISTDARASRPMLSLLTRSEFGPAASIDPDDPTPPLAEPSSYYWRYEIPPSSAPYFALDYQRQVLARLIPSAAELALAPLQQCALAVAPRPMFGRGFNNCTQVDITLEDALELWQPRPCNLLRGSIDLRSFHWDGAQFVDAYWSESPAPAQSVLALMRVRLDAIDVYPPPWAVGPANGGPLYQTVFDVPGFPRMLLRVSYSYPNINGDDQWFANNQIYFLSAC